MSSGKYKEGKKVNVLCIVARNHERSVVVLDHFRNLVDSGYNIEMGEYLSREEEIIVRN